GPAGVRPAARAPGGVRGDRRPQGRGVRGAVPAGAPPGRAAHPAAGAPRPGGVARGVGARSEEVLMVGDGALASRHLFERLREQVELGSPAQSWPSAACLVELAVPRFEREEFVSPFEVTPQYLRRPDIDPDAERRVGGLTKGTVE